MLGVGARVRFHLRMQGACLFCPPVSSHVRTQKIGKWFETRWNTAVDHELLTRDFVTVGWC